MADLDVKLRNDLAESARNAESSALKWICEHQHYFNPLVYSNGRRFNLALKAMAELAILCDLAIAHNRDTATAKIYRELASYLWSDAFCHEALQDHLLTEEIGLLTVGIYGSLRQCGYEDRGYRIRLIRLLQEGYISAAERVPHRELDYIYSLWRAGFPSSEDLIQSTYRRTLLAQHPKPSPLTTEDVYGITHVIFFLTGFGLIKPACFNGEDLKYFDLVFPRLLQFYLRKGNWDLSSEMLICLQHTNLRFHPVYEDAWAVLLSQQQADGTFPDSIPANDKETGEESDNKAAEPPAGSVSMADWAVFRDNYHTTLLMLTACLALP
jgi:hypothetical protein